MKYHSLKFSILFASIVLILFSACKKETPIPDDPTIIYRNINKTFTASIGGDFLDSLDLNYDGKYDVDMKIYNSGSDSGVVSFYEKHYRGFEAVRDDSKNILNPTIKVFVKDELTPLPLSFIYSFTEGHLFIVLKESGLRGGITNGDGYLVFRFSTGTKYQYGWMKVSINSAFTEFKIIEYAYSIDPDTPIKVGAK